MVLFWLSIICMCFSNARFLFQYEAPFVMSLFRALFFREKNYMHYSLDKKLHALFCSFLSTFLIQYSTIFQYQSYFCL
jgi:hypothetical protein